MSDSEGCRLRKDPDKNGIEEHKPDKIFRPDKPIHKPSVSLLSELDAIPGRSRAIISLLLGAAVSLFLENRRSHTRINAQQGHNNLSGSQTEGLETGSSIIYVLLYSCVPAVVSLFLEKGLAKNKIPQKIGMIAHILNISHLFLLPGVLIYCNFSTFSAEDSTCICIIYFIQVLKLWSYVHVNYWCRVSRDLPDTALVKQNGFNSQTSKDKDSLVQYPGNLVFKDMAYYFFAPTVCYELNFPRTNRIRKRFLIKCLLEMIIAILIKLSLNDWMFDSIRNALTTSSTTDDLLKKIELHLKMFVSSNLCCLPMVFAFFHSYLNMLAELMYFADRTFYLDWWNASNTRFFWKTWNVSIHRWFLRHIYRPLRGMGYSRKVGLLASFSISGLFHEYLHSAPLKIFACLIFFEFLCQVPIVDCTEWIDKHFGATFGFITHVSFFFINIYIVMITYYYPTPHVGQSAIDSYHNLTDCMNSNLQKCF